MNIITDIPAVIGTFTSVDSETQTAHIDVLVKAGEGTPELVHMTLRNHGGFCTLACDDTAMVVATYVAKDMKRIYQQCLEEACVA